jgi:hypothetical protein
MLGSSAVSYPQDGRPSGSDRSSLLRGYRFGLCATPEDAASALAVRREVYQRGCGYDVPVPDRYDARSWLLVARHAGSGAAVGTIRLTPRSAGSLEAEEYFDLLPRLRSPRVIEATRFAILPGHRDSGRFLPVVALGLFKLAVRLVERLGADYAVVCARPERVWTYQWLRFERTGLSAVYRKLGDTLHELLTCDLRFGVERYREHRYWDFFFARTHPEIELPQRMPPLGLPTDQHGTERYNEEGTAC